MRLPSPFLVIGILPAVAHAAETRIQKRAALGVGPTRLGFVPNPLPVAVIACFRRRVSGQDPGQEFDGEERERLRLCEAAAGDDGGED